VYRVLGRPLPMPLPQQYVHTLQQKLQESVRHHRTAAQEQHGLRGTTTVRQRRCHGLRIRLQVESSWNVMAHCDAGRGSEGETGEWSGYPVLFTLPRNIVYSALLTLMRTPRLPVVYWTDAPAGLNGLVRFAERRNLVSARVPSYFKRSLQQNIAVSPEWFVMSDSATGQWSAEPNWLLFVDICWSSWDFASTGQHRHNCNADIRSYKNGFQAQNQNFRGL
jgi:hypothetical protein